MKPHIGLCAFGCFISSLDKLALAVVLGLIHAKNTQTFDVIFRKFADDSLKFSAPSFVLNQSTSS